MKRSKHVAAPLVASAALAFLAGCRKQEMQRCVDEHNVVVDDSLCGNANGPQNNNYYHPGGGIYPSPFRWYYGGWGGYGLGSTIGGGSYAPIAGHSYASSTVRGGFGSTHASGGEGGHGGGE
jgi:hypothetical protein